MPLIVFYIFMITSQTLGIVVSAKQHKPWGVALFVGLYVIEAAIITVHLIRKRK